MQFISSTEEDLAAANAAQRVEDNFYHRQVLRRLLEYGETVIAVEEQKAALQSQVVNRPGADGTDKLPDLGDRFKELSRAMRLTILLADKLGKPLKPAADPPARHEIDPTPPAETKAVAPRKPRGTSPEVPERPDRPDRLEDIGGRPQTEIIAEICEAPGIEAPAEAAARPLAAAIKTFLAQQPRAAAEAPAQPTAPSPRPPRHTGTGPP